MDLFEKAMKEDEIQCRTATVSVLSIYGVLTSVIPILSIIANIIWSNSMTLFIMIACLVLWGALAAVIIVIVVAIKKKLKKLKAYLESEE